ncbi:hypothetical protein OUZ56_027894 [Daphnia magna]|uniref:Uncharacterized protein n=1 Tax=Daphnia magna TaxID=35525 RepID=A0ABR0B284_9CRUS|nr:hypothetical protein OUZ56_027894 [Daphnia magna]
MSVCSSVYLPRRLFTIQTTAADSPSVFGAGVVFERIAQAATAATNNPTVPDCVAPPTGLLGFHIDALVVSWPVARQ